jgi:hypothetical protein
MNYSARSTFYPQCFYKLSVVIATLAMAWFALGTALNTMVAHASGKRIDIVVCSGAGVKTISVPVHDSDDTASTIKHCGNAPIYTLLDIPGAPTHLHFKAPSTVAVWQWNPLPDVAISSIPDSKPPPGRAPPARIFAA